MKKNILFDLDGTLTDSKRGIINSCQYALDHMCLSMIDPTSCNWIIGPPIYNSFQKFFPQEEEVEKAIAFYREYFIQKGLYENDVYENIQELLEKLIDKNLYVATGKPEIYAKRILQYFNLDQYFIDICGTTLTKERTTKTQVIEYAISKNKLNAADTIMVGDRIHDIEGAKNNHISSVGVLYGYGSKEEFEFADYVVEDIAELYQVLR